MAADDPQPGLPLELKTNDAIVRHAFLMLQQNMDAPPGVDEIAQRLEVSRRKLERHFNQSLGIAPSKAFLLVRLAQVKMLLRRSDDSIARIAADTGFCDASHLIRSFGDRMGTTPDVWRHIDAPSALT